MSLGNSDKMSYGLTHCPHVDRLLISTGLLPRVSVLNKGVDNGVERLILSWIHDMSAELAE
jgi:hypothetical protein